MLSALGRETWRFAASLAAAAIFAAVLGALSGWGAHGGFFWAFAMRLWDILSLDFGRSLVSGTDVFAGIAPALSASASLVVAGLLTAFILGVPLGLAVTGSNTRTFAVPLVEVAGSVPVFCGALAIAIAVARFAPQLGPARDGALQAAIDSGNGTAILASLAALAPLVLPVGFAGAGVIAAAVSGAVTGALAEPYRDTLHRLGIEPREILRVYVGRRALARVVTALGDAVLAAIAATIVVELLFDWPGAGALFFRACSVRDWPVVSGIVFAVAAVRIAADYVGAVLSAALTGVSR